MATKVRDQKITKQFAIYRDDCCRVLPELPEESIGFSVFSPPFVSLYQYSDDEADMGNSESVEVFFTHFGYLVDQLQRVMMPGRVVAVHCMELPTLKRNGEEIGLWDFPGALVQCFLDRGFIYHSRHCIWKDPLLQAVRTKAIGLAHKQIVKDSTMCRMGLADYILAFRKPGDNPKPVANPDGLTEYHGSRKVPMNLDSWVDWEGAQNINKRSHWIWQQYASPVWFDVRQTNVMPFRDAREDDDEKHICPLQLDVIERCLALWSTRGDTVLTPFMGVGSEVYCALRNGRKAVGIELKDSYYRQALGNIKSLKNREQMNKGFSL